MNWARVFASFLLGLAVAFLAFKPGPGPTPPPPAVADGYEMAQLARTREGAAVYRLAGPKIIVPLVFVVGTDGSVCVR